MIHKFLSCSLFLYLLPLYLIILSNENLKSELELYKKKWKVNYIGYIGFVFIFRILPEYRSLVYYRLRNRYAILCSHLYKGQTNFYIEVKGTIGRNLMVWHGFSTIINAQSIGDNCEIWQQVTIGNKFNEDSGKPRIGSNVKICAGAIIVGDVEIGDNSVIGAGAVVIRDVPANVIVGGVPARILKSI